MTLLLLLLIVLLLLLLLSWPIVVLVAAAALMLLCMNGGLRLPSVAASACVARCAESALAVRLLVAAVGRNVAALLMLARPELPRLPLPIPPPPNPAL